METNDLKENLSHKQVKRRDVEVKRSRSQHSIPCRDLSNEKKKKRKTEKKKKKKKCFQGRVALSPF